MNIFARSILSLTVFVMGVVLASALANTIGEDDSTRAVLGFIFGLPVGVLSAVTFIATE